MTKNDEAVIILRLSRGLKNKIRADAEKANTTITSIIRERMSQSADDTETLAQMLQNTRAIMGEVARLRVELREVVKSLTS